MTELQQTRYDRLLRRVGGLIGPGSKVGEVLSDLFPVLDVERVPGELLRLSETKILIGGTTLQSGVGDLPSIQVFNPEDSGNLVVVSSVDISAASGTTFVIGVSVAEFADFVARMTSRDTRGTIIIQGVAQIRTTDTIAFSSAGSFAFRLGGNITHTITDENSVAVLFPGTGFFVQSSTTNSFLSCGFMVRERPFLESELLQ